MQKILSSFNFNDLFVKHQFTPPDLGLFLWQNPQVSYLNHLRGELLLTPRELQEDSTLNVKGFSAEQSVVVECKPVSFIANSAKQIYSGS